MSNPQRLVYPSPWKHIHQDQELRVADSEQAEKWGGVPREFDVAAAVAAMPDEWFEAFVVSLGKRSPNRSAVVVRTTDPAQLDANPPELNREALVEELDKIDHALETFGFDSTRQVQEMTGAFERLRHLELERGLLTTEAERVPELVKKIQRQRLEIRRFNRDAKARAEGFREAFKDGAITAVRTLLDYLSRQSPPWATDRALQNFKEFLEAWIGNSEMINRKP